ncbi:hypothetical protein BaRGS_00009853 [Batillaria attramentaria]|uniref:Uncharacterized protein n=1 Tax=Batillaria attramentaria TaxID=370345 RepID=A0ABD0LGW7_9CAEN
MNIACISNLPQPEDPKPGVRLWTGLRLVWTRRSSKETQCPSYEHDARFFFAGGTTGDVCARAMGPLPSTNLTPVLITSTLIRKFAGAGLGKLHPIRRPSSLQQYLGSRS